MAERIDIEGDWERVEKRYLWVQLISTVIGGIILMLIVGVILFFATSQNWLAIGLSVGGIFVLTVINASFSYFRTRTIGFQQRSDDFMMRQGMMFRRFVAVPYGRLQIVDIEQGPIERMFGLKKLKFVTAAAGSGVVLPGLSAERAERLRDELVDAAESRRAGL